jgi:transcriptional regulator with GAF, ATPase, and Fis domain
MQDLYNRLFGLPLRTSSQREKKATICYCLQNTSSASTVKKIKLKTESSPPLHKKNFFLIHIPGNNRDLKTVVELAVTLSDTDVYRSR